MDRPPLIILSSARKNGDTHKLVNSLFADKEVVLLDLLDHKIAPYSYSGQYPADDQFRDLVQEMLLHSAIVFATPVYWYSMSGSLKTFFDRLTDLVTINKQHGRQMKGKVTYLLAVGAEEVLPIGFEGPFALTSAYFDMQYKGCYYCSTKNLYTLPNKEQFLKKLYNRM